MPAHLDPSSSFDLKGKNILKQVQIPSSYPTILVSRLNNNVVGEGISAHFYSSSHTFMMWSKYSNITYSTETVLLKHLNHNIFNLNFSNEPSTVSGKVTVHNWKQ